jgi:hypothetical protein
VVSEDVRAPTAREPRSSDRIRRRRESSPAPDTASAARRRRLTIIRRTAVTVWAVVIVYLTITDGFAFNRELLLLYIAIGLAAASIGRHRMLMVIRDWLPFAVVLLLYDISRGAAKLLGTSTMWQPQIDWDRWLFAGTVPTVWLQERLKEADPPWWEVSISTVYMSFFILPYVVAGVLWLRNRDDWKAFVRRFVVLSFTALAIYVIFPAAPPWAAAQCTPGDVAGGPAYPACIYGSPAGVPGGGLLGAMQMSEPGANPFVERISTRGFSTLHLHVARDLVNSGQMSVNMVAAVPSLHAALTAMVSLFLWRRVSRRWRPLLVAYPLMMAFALVYSAEHYVIDLLLGWALAAVVLAVMSSWEARRAAKPPDTSGAVTAERIDETSDEPTDEPDPVPQRV